MDQVISFVGLLVSYFGYILIVVGGIFMLTGVIGILRFPDFFTRLHPAGVIDSLGASLIILGLILSGKIDFISIKVVLLIIFILVTAPTACHALAKAALLDGLKPLDKVINKRKR